VAPYFQSPQLGDEFANVTIAMDYALQQQSLPALHTAMRDNHQLLAHIGVVPPPVQAFITQIENSGGAAKVCGAGAVSGDRAGVVLVMLEDAINLSALCTRFGYQPMPIANEARGVYAI
jgi:mevalonate kinase